MRPPGFDYRLNKENTMTALTRFIERNDLTTDRLNLFFGGAVAAAIISAATPVRAETMPTVDVGTQNVEIIRLSSERVSDHMQDVVKVKKAIEDIAGTLTLPKAIKAKMAARAEATAFADSPNPQIAKYDGYILQLASTVPEESKASDIVGYVNWQKTQLVHATLLLDALRDSFSNGDRNGREAAALRLSDLIENYNSQTFEVSFDDGPVADASTETYHVDMAAVRAEIGQRIDTSPVGELVEFTVGRLPVEAVQQADRPDLDRQDVPVDRQRQIVEFGHAPLQQVDRPASDRQEVTIERDRQRQLVEIERQGERQLVEIERQRQRQLVEIERTQLRVELERPTQHVEIDHGPSFR
jgi:hypothetical protein